MKDAEHACQAILYRYEIGDIVTDRGDHVFLNAVLSRHPRARDKIRCGVLRFEIRQNLQYPGQRSIFLIRMDGSDTDFGYRKCLKPPTMEQEVTAALRHAISDQIVDFVKRAFGSDKPVNCAVTGVVMKSYAEAHVDHAPPTFLDLAETFVAEQGGWTRFALSRADRQVGARLADAALAAEWAAYHRRRAELRLVTINANLSVLKKRRAEQP